MSNSNTADGQIPLRLRAGRKAFRTLYAQVGPEPSDADLLIGIVDTATLATTIVAAYNAYVGSGDEPTE